MGFSPSVAKKPGASPAFFLPSLLFIHFANLLGNRYVKNVMQITFFKQIQR